MKKTIIVPLTKSPLPDKGRIGPREKQDWYQSLILAKKLLAANENSFIYIISKVRIKGVLPEADLYEQTLEKLDVPKEKIVTIRRAYETTVQCRIAFEEAERENANLIIISTPFHYPRVRWICRGKAAKHYIAWGQPRIKEMCTDIILIILFPLLDLLGLDTFFRNLVNSWRIRGRQ